jgi:hypothetical protein
LLVPRTPAGRFVAVLAALACSAALVGCQANPEPAPLPSESPSATAPSEAGSPSPAPPTMPAEARGTSEKSAKAFVRFYIDALNFATATGDTHVAREFSDHTCNSCDAMLDKIEEVYREGGFFRGRGWAVTNIKYQPLQPRERPVLSVGIQLAPQEMVEVKGEDPKHFTGGPNHLTFHLSRTQSGWRVEKLDRLS